MEKILFLDMDGVILSGEALWKSGDNRSLPAAQMALLNEVCQRTGCKVVLSSTWRMEGASIKAHIEKEGFTGPWHEAWRTPTINLLHKDGLVLGIARRGHEIERYLDTLSSLELTCDAYAIIDDDSDMLDDQLPFFVKTEFETGLQRQHADRLIAILGDLTEQE